MNDRKKRAALRKLRKAAALAEQGLGPALSDWEKQFLEEVETRIETYGSAFADPMKGHEGEALSSLQQVKLREIDKKARGKARKGFQSKGTFGKRPSPRIRQIEEEVSGPDEPAEVTSTPPQRRVPELVRAPDIARQQGKTHLSGTARTERPALRLIKGGKNDN